MNRYVWLLLILLVCGCKGRHDSNREHKKGFFLSNPIVKEQRDSMKDGFYKNKYFSPTIIRLGRQDKEAFIWIDSPLFNVKRLDNTNREAYYDKVIPLLPKEDIEVYSLIWAVPEMRKMQTGDGGFGTVVATITTRPDKENPFYVAEIRINNIDEMPPANDIAFFRIRLNPLLVELSDQSGYYVSLEEWDHVNKNK